MAFHPSRKLAYRGASLVQYRSILADERPLVVIRVELEQENPVSIADPDLVTWFVGGVNICAVEVLSTSTDDEVAKRSSMTSGVSCLDSKALVVMVVPGK